MLSNVPDCFDMDHIQVVNYRQTLHKSIMEDEFQLNKLLPLIQNLQKSYDEVERSLIHKKSVLSNLIMYETMQENTIHLLEDSNDYSNKSNDINSVNTSQSLISVSPPADFQHNSSIIDQNHSRIIENNNNKLYNKNTSNTSSHSTAPSNDNVYVATVTMKIAEDSLRNAGGKLIGVNGSNIKKIRRDCACCIHLRGRGSTKPSELNDLQNKNKASISKAFEPLHVIIQSVHNDRDIAIENVNKAIDRVIQSLDRGMKGADSSRHEITNLEIKETKKRYNKKSSLYS
uniref:KH domain-containing protein n=1 Tax=Strongyloides venezuelensis TaxID=75913 RepID=A0A0K0FAC4_STRVS